MKLTVIYRISNGSYDKDRIATKERCLRNFVETFMWWDTDKLVVMEDNCNRDTARMVFEVIAGGHFTKNVDLDKPSYELHEIKGGSSAQSFNIALDYAVKLPEDEYVYFVEDDYLHWVECRKVMEEGLERAHYVSLYDHPDKYINGDDGGNPHVDDGGEITRVFRTPMCHWKLTNSTTMTFATSIRILKADEKIWRKFTEGTYPLDFDAFMYLRNIGRTVATPLPGFSTHTERKWLTPYRDWSSI
jgi:hypothetical protein